MKNPFIYFLKSLKLERILLGSTLSFLVILFLLKIIFPLLGQLTFSRTGFQVNNYYSVVAITLICFFPYLIGALYINPRNNFLLIRMFGIAFICFVFVLLTIIITKPVPTEGWLRNLFAAWLLSIQAPFICLMICTLVEKKVKRIPVCIISFVFLIAVPFGLLVHHPWNYLVFFSPFYWLSWAWIIKTPVESFIYGAISVFITSLTLTVILSNLLRKK